MNQFLDKTKQALPWLIFFSGVVFGWVGLYALSGQMPFAPVLGTFSAEFSLAHGMAGFTLLFAMWGLMSLAMMLPSATPMFATFLDLSQNTPRPLLAQGAFLGGYCAVWLSFSALAALLQQQLYLAAMVDGAGVSLSPILSLVLLVLAGAYQFSAFKQSCVRKCRAPMSFFFSFWRDGISGAFAMGLRHGGVCLGCCWALMLLAFVGGTMNLAFMGLGLVLMTMEKLPLVGEYTSGAVGFALLAFAAAYGIWLLTGGSQNMTTFLN